MKIINNTIGKKLLLLTLFMLSLSGFAQTNFTVSLANGQNPTPTTFEVDVMLSVNSPVEGVRLSSVAFGINYNPAILNGGTPCTSAGCGSWSMVPGTRDNALSGLNPSTLTNRLTPVGHLRATMTNLTGAASIDIAPGMYRVGTYRFTNTVAFTSNSNAQLWIQPTNTAGATNTIVSFYPFGQTTPIAAYTTTNPAAGAGLSLSHASASTLTLMLNATPDVCFTSGSFVQTPPTCLGNSDGTATITMDPIPGPSLAASYSLDGGASTPITLTAAGSFTLTGLSAGAHTLSVTGSGSCTTPVSVPFTVDAGATPTINSTSVSACDTYTWANNGQTYTASGTYTGTTTNCVTEELVLTITPSSTNTTTASACDTYTWANNGQTYTASGTYTGTTTNCVTEELVLTITPSSTNTTTASACDTYTWAHNGQTYTASGTYTGTTTNCVTEELVLTITPSSNNTTTVTQCNTYTWANNGQTYTTSGIYTGTTTNCVTEVLDLTITPGSFNTLTITACDTYTWAENGQTYTVSGTYTGSTTACVTEQLVLTIVPSSTNSTSVSACDTYTWANNGQTYTASGTYTGTTTNCVTEELVLTITPSSTNSTSVSACDTYTWANNGQTYTASGTYTGTTTNCVTEELVLTITPSSTNSTAVTACETYTWAVNGQTYTASGTYAGGVVNCVTEELVLTIQTTPTVTENVTACYTYTWPVDGQTYTASGTYTFSSPPVVAPSWCTAGTTTQGCNTGDEFIENVTIGAINNNSSCVVGGYQDFTAMSTAVSAGSSYPISVTNGNSWSGSQIMIWADWNHDGDFTDSGESYTTAYTHVAPNGTSVAGTANLAVPAGATNGATRMRIRVMFTGTPSSCGSIQFGEVEDYTLNVTGGVEPTVCGTNNVLVLTISGTPAGDDLATAIAANGLTSTINGNNLATNCFTNNGGRPSPDVWYMVTLEDCAATLSANTCSSTASFDTYVRIMAADGTTELGANDDSCPESTFGLSQLDNVDVSAHDVVYVVVEGWNAGDQGNYVLNLTQTIQQTVPTFTQVGPICAGDTSASLPTTSDNGVTGTWAPAFDNTATTTYTFTPDAGQCTSATLTTMEVVVTPTSTNTTTASACDTYTWANNGQTYTASGTYTGTTTNCVTEELVLTITPSSTNTTTATACDTYTWAHNGQTYTTSGTYTGTTTACVTEQLVLTINNSTTNGNLTITASGSYTWNTPTGNGQTYTTSGTYTSTTTNAAGCPNVATLNLTITVGTPTVNTFNVGTSCGATISNLAVTITATPVSGASSYMFRITNVATSGVIVVTRPVNSFALSNVAGITLGTQYTIEVSVNGGANYGAPCTVFTPAPSSSIGAQCGTTLTSMTQFVYATYVSSVTGYRFRVTNTATSSSVVYDALSGQNRFHFNQLPPAFVSFGTTYYVEVALRNTDGTTYLPYSAGCNITTPAFPTSEVVLSQCDYTATSNTQSIAVVTVPSATAYRIQLVNSALSYSFSLDRTVANFTLSMFPGLLSGTTYTVRVAVRINGVWGPLTGKPCNLTTPGSAPITRTDIASDKFAAIAYPNPFAENFMFDVQTTAQSTIQVRVYDMLGKQVENKNVEVSDINNIQFGDNYPSGVYNVIVSQGEHTQTLRVIKR